MTARDRIVTSFENIRTSIDFVVISRYFVLIAIERIRIPKYSIEITCDITLEAYHVVPRAFDFILVSSRIIVLAVDVIVRTSVIVGVTNDNDMITKHNVL